MSSTKRKAPPVRIAKPRTTTSAKPSTRPRLNDKLSVVSVPKQQQQQQSKKSDAAIEISSDEEDIDDENVEIDEAAKTFKEDTDMADIPQTNGAAKDTPAESNDDDNDDADADADAEPTFGDLVREHGTVDVAAALGLLKGADGDASAVAGAAKGGAAAPNLASLGQLLNAALRSGDDANLELCFTTSSSTDSSWIRNTIQRLDPSLAGTLLQKLAARIHRRPGRAHTLIGWVQWTLITHGGALLTNQPGVTTRALQELHRVLEERARGLNSLLLLKGKLDMLEAQMQLRRVQRGGRAFSGMGGDAYQADAAVVGRVASSAIDNVNGRRGGRRGRRAAGAASSSAGRAKPGFKVYREGRDDLDEEDDDNEEEDSEDEAGQILVNGAEIAGESFIDGSDDEVEALDEEDDEDSEDDDEGDDAEEDDLEEDDEDAEEDEVDFDDVDDEDDDDDDDDEIEESATAAPPPAKMQKKSGGAFSKRR